MNLRRVLIWIGLTAILAGSLVPIYKQEDTLYFYLRGLSGTYIVIALVAAFAALAMKKDDMLWIFGLIFLGWFINDLRFTWEQISDIDRAHLSWGWILLFNGAIFLILTLFLGEDFDRIRAFFTPISPEEDIEDEDETPEGEAEEQASGTAA